MATKMTREEAIKIVQSATVWTDEERDALAMLIPELAESKDENFKNKSGYYKAGKFWKASTLWNATKDKIPQRVSNRYILQECTWNIGTLQRFANEVKNVQEVSLDYPIILDMNGNILDGAHRVVKAYLEGKDIDIVYLGDDEWPEPDYDEEKAVKESEDERIRKALIDALKTSKSVGELKFILPEPTREECIAYLEKQKEQKLVDYEHEMWKNCEANFEGGKKEVIEHPEKYGLQKPAEWSEEDKEMLEYVIGDVNDAKQLFATKEAIDLCDKEITWLKSLRPSWKPSEEQMEAVKHAYNSFPNDCPTKSNLRLLYHDLEKLM